MKIIPQDSHVLNPHGEYIDSQWFTNAHHENPIMQIIEQSKIEFILIPKGYLASLKSEGVASWEDCETESVSRDEIKFISALTLDEVGDKLRVLREFSKAKLTLYHRRRSKLIKHHFILHSTLINLTPLNQNLWR